MASSWKGEARVQQEEEGLPLAKAGVCQVPPSEAGLG